ncbi:cytochrome P450 [Vararia minispora EC-137]|uniref:Cytochrome P450 n=1 Tax=Vararia minispora EC-137 TaxID=1314806 RepID=A0ACB8Q6X5_9AGAM|nr:cytochrome P450 [Vararia minispora EC-137]
MALLVNMDVPSLVSSWHRSLVTQASHPTFTITAGILLATYFSARYFSSPWRRLPPGPAGYPIIGSALEIFDNKQSFIEKCRAYGEVVYVNLAGQPAVIFNTQRAAADLLDRRATTFSARPRAIVAHELLTNGLFMITEGYTDRWRRMRRAVNEGFRPMAAARYHAMETQEAARLALSLARDMNASTPVARAGHYARYAASLALAIIYDRPVRDTAEDEHMAATIQDLITHLESASAPGAHFVEFAKWKRDALEGHARFTQFLDGLVEDVKRRMVIGEARQCLVRSFIEENQRFELSDVETSWTAGTMYVASVETEVATLEWITLVLATYPEVQRRAQAELDAVIGHSRPPRVSDRAHLSYITAVVREVMRWKPATPISVPHMSEEDEWYKGMFIPKGTICMVNAAACNMDPQACNLFAPVSSMTDLQYQLYGADAADFNPDRYLDGKGQLQPSPPDTKDEGHVTYGFGRRICAGRHVANDALFAAISTILWAFNLSTIGEFDLDRYVDKGISK